MDTYRSISTLPISSKLLEKILYEQEHEYLSTNGLWSERFKRFYSTTTPLLDCPEWYVNMAMVFLI